MAIKRQDGTWTHAKFTARRVVTRALESGGGGGNSGAMESRISKLEALIPTLATKADIGEVRADLHKMDASIVRWMIATVIGLFLGFAGLFFTVSSAFKGSSMQPVAAQPQPIIIQIPSPTGQDSQYQPARGETDRRPQLQRPTGDKDPPK